MLREPEEKNTVKWVLSSLIADPGIRSGKEGVNPERRDWPLKRRERT